MTSHSSNNPWFFFLLFPVPLFFSSFLSFILLVSFHLSFYFPIFSLCFFSSLLFFFCTFLSLGIAIAGGGVGSQAAAEDVLIGDSSFLQEKALLRYKAVVGSEGERFVFDSNHILSGFISLHLIFIVLFLELYYSSSSILLPIHLHSWMCYNRNLCIKTVSIMSYLLSLALPIEDIHEKTHQYHWFE